MVKPGIYKNITIKEYHSMEGLSKSMLDKIAISPAHLKQAMDEGTKDTDALIFGRLFHTIVLEPRKFKKEFAIEPIVNKRTNEGKAILQEFYEANQGKDIVTQEDVDKAKLLKKQLMKNEIIKKLLTGGDREVSIFWKDKETGELCKARPDILQGDIIIDLKTTTTAKPGEFDKKAYDYGYHKQAYWFLEAYKNATGNDARFVFIAIEKEPPYAVSVFMANDTMIKIGEIEARADLRLFHECKTNKKWPGYDLGKPQIFELSVPGYVLNKYMEEIQ